jgi:hypothetical protein
MTQPVWCNLCNRNVVPQKKFNWLVFIFLCGLFYLPYYLLKEKKCPICGAANFGPARFEEMGRSSNYMVIQPAEKREVNSSFTEQPKAQFGDRNAKKNHEEHYNKRMQKLMKEVEIRCSKSLELYHENRIDEKEYIQYMHKLARSLIKMKDERRIDEESFEKLKRIVNSYYEKRLRK